MNTMNLTVEPLEALEAPWDWNTFFVGVGIGVTIGVALT
jgi:hypothetical protein